MRELQTQVDSQRKSVSLQLEGRHWADRRWAFSHKDRDHTRHLAQQTQEHSLCNMRCCCQAPGHQDTRRTAHPPEQPNPQGKADKQIY